MKTTRQTPSRWAVALLGLLLAAHSLAACSGPRDAVNQAQAVATDSSANARALAEWLQDRAFHGGLAPKMVDAPTLRAALDSAPASVLLLDLRPAEAFAQGHIAGAVNLGFGELAGWFESDSLRRYERVVMLCGNGQSATYAAALARLSGHENVSALKWGMSAWSPAIAVKVWQAALSDTALAMVEQTTVPKPPKGDLPLVPGELGDTASLLKARVRELLAQGFAPARLSIDDLLAKPDSFQLVAMMYEDDYYSLGHLPGAFNIALGDDLALRAELERLPNDRPIAVYCHSGFQGAYAAAYLRLLGYDAYTLLNGANGFMRSRLDSMPTKSFPRKGGLHDFPLER